MVENFQNLVGGGKKSWGDFKDSWSGATIRGGISATRGGAEKLEGKNWKLVGVLRNSSGNESQKLVGT